MKGENNNIIENINETPLSDSNIFEFNGDIITIDTHIVDIILNDLDQIFVLKNFDSLKTEQQVLDFFCDKEKKSLEYIELNFKRNKKEFKFFKNFISEMLEEKYRYNKSLLDIRNSIDIKINEIVEEIVKSEDLNYYNLTKKYMELFKTNRIPEFLEKNIFESVDSINLIKNLNQKSETNKTKYIKETTESKQLVDSLTLYYHEFLNKESIPFKDGNKEVLFQILIYSNLEDCYKRPRIKDIFLNNYLEIANCLDYYEGISEFENALNNKKEFIYINNKLKIIFDKYEINDKHLYNIVSFFYLVMNQMKYQNQENIKENILNNNLNNPLFNRILKNVLSRFATYCPHKIYTSELYIYLLNYLTKFIIVNKKDDIINKKYEAKDIEEKINNSDKYKCIEEFESIKSKISSLEFLSEFFKKLKDYITLVPLTKHRTSNTITILISGFMSQKDDIDSWSYFFNSDRENTNYYMYKWPSSTVFSFAVKTFINTMFSFTAFKACYEKAEYAGRILALFLLNNNEFSDCQINLVGFSLGCHVLLNCLKEINKIGNHRLMINNILLMGGASIIEDDEKKYWRNIFINNVGGRVINCFSDFDKVLKYLFTTCMGKTPIGIKEINIFDETGEYPIVDNYDFSDYKLGHLKYRKNFDLILKRINFFKWN